MSLFQRFFQKLWKPNSKIVRLHRSDFKRAIWRNPGKLVDVRSKREYQLGAIPGAANHDIKNRMEFVQASFRWSHSEPIYLYCQSGMRSMKAARLLSRNGFKNIYELKGGFSQYDR